MFWIHYTRAKPYLKNVPECNDISFDATVGWVARNRLDGITKKHEYEEIHLTISPSRLWEPKHSSSSGPMGPVESDIHISSHHNIVQSLSQFRTFKEKGVIIIPWQNKAP